ncbi:MAG TPA: ATP-grasp domain-containing protein [Kofleriaceae bacterium]|nr:ATP-grasp domain-containing protein [Kofleriaceae bacterium]
MIGAGTEQVPVIDVAHELDVEVIAVDGDPRAPGFAAADACYPLDLGDVAAIVDRARAHRCRFILPAPLGAFLVTVGAVNDALGFRGLSERAARNCTDKERAHRCLREACLPVADSASVSETTTSAVAAAAERLGYPVVVKPSRGSGSRGVFVARDRRELDAWLPHHLEERARLPAPQHTLVERHIAGRELGVDGAMIGAELHLVLVRDKELTPLPHRLGHGYLAPADIDGPTAAALEDALARAARAVGLRDCLLHADVIVDGSGGPHVIELAGRPSGFHIASRMIPAAIDVSPMREMIAHLLGDRPALAPRCRRGSVLRMLHAEAGTLRAVSGIEEAAAMPGVVACETYLGRGDVIHPPVDGRTGFRCGYLLTAGADRAEAEDRWQAAASRIRWEMET